MCELASGSGTGLADHEPLERRHKFLLLLNNGLLSADMLYECPPLALAVEPDYASFGMSGL